MPHVLGNVKFTSRKIPVTLEPGLDSEPNKRSPAVGSVPADATVVLAISQFPERSGGAVNELRNDPPPQPLDSITDEARIARAGSFMERSEQLAGRNQG